VPLTWSTSSDEFSRVFVNCWPKESTLPNLCMCAECPIMSSIWWWVASLNNLYSFFSRYTSSE
jgi:hypothetical protein